jgi:hypothetical protein
MLPIIINYMLLYHQNKIMTKGTVLLSPAITIKSVDEAYKCCSDLSNNLSLDFIVNLCLYYFHFLVDSNSFGLITYVYKFIFINHMLLVIFLFEYFLLLVYILI